jgi:hypothetical protein
MHGLNMNQDGNNEAQMAQADIVYIEKPPARFTSGGGKRPPI